MGEVYRAEDTKLDREVAIKVLPEVFTQDPERLARFEREAKLLAQLHHPNIASIFGIEEAEGIRALVMELVEGPTLAERLASGPLPLDESLQIARQIAEALEVAHEKGIVHRDLKPQNVKLTTAGTVKVLDFGLAKAMEPTADASGTQTASPTLMNSPTLTAAGTQLGVILGTAAYMAPEQAKGQPVDKRADIWAFGVLLYEMLTGRLLFAGDSVPETLAGVLKSEIDFAALPAATPAAIHRLLHRCLERNPTNRLHDIADARIEIDAAREAGDETPTAAVGEVPSPRRGLWIAGLAVAALVGALAAWQLRPAPPRASWKLHLAPPNEIGEPRLDPRIAPDGRSIAYLAADRLWVQEFDRFTPRQVPKSEGASTFSWSPDGRSLAFTVRTQLWRTLPSGDSQLVAELPEAPGSAGGVAWLAGDTLVFAAGDGGLLAVPAAGGSLRTWLEPERPRESDFHEPVALPNGRGVVFVVHRDLEGSDTLELFDGEQRRTLYQQEGASFDTPAWSPSGHVLFGQLGASPGVWALPVDSATLEVSGEPFLVSANMSSPSVSSDGALLLSTLTGTGQHQVSLVDLEGRIVEEVGEAVAHADAATLAPDGKRLALCLFEAKSASVWIYDLERGTRSRLWADTGCGGKDGGIVWSADGQRLVTTDHDSGRILMRLADGSDQEMVLTEGKQPDLSPDGRFLVFSRESEEDRKDLWMLDLNGGEPTPILATPVSEEEPRISPDGRYLAYVSDESGRNEVYLRPFPERSGRWQVSTEGGDYPRWSEVGDRLFFIQDADRIMVAEVGLQATPVLGNPRLLFTATAGRFGPEHGYDVAPDGESLVMVALGGGSLAGGDLTLISPWPDESAED